MFEAYDPERDLKFEALFSQVSHQQAIKEVTLPSYPDDNCRIILQTGFRTRVMSFHSAYALGARSGFSLSSLKERIPVCAAMIRAGLSCAIDETLFAALVYHYEAEARRIANANKPKHK
ncbi:hypothetical protein [Cohaesibacter gelatinilyticus]|uniref:Uncharacterized protein n=1 Tax=Cohaesibacter gelatinilyticus TaxID=372072 RepID=A0A285N8I1_9HYPH|nr:hypothetical protein [Cohaesibacter gelatinilyticus]SNZ05720.1 hypothetical protein SAMN06265368_0189 [Cohaesibacter gelatinilyticus]